MTLHWVWGWGARNTYTTTQCSFLLSPDSSREIIQDGGSMIERDGKNDFSVKGEKKWRDCLQSKTVVKLQMSVFNVLLTLVSYL